MVFMGTVDDGRKLRPKTFFFSLPHCFPILFFLRPNWESGRGRSFGLTRTGAQTKVECLMAYLHAVTGYPAFFKAFSRNLFFLFSLLVFFVATSNALSLRTDFKRYVLFHIFRLSFSFLLFFSFRFLLIHMNLHRFKELADES